MRYFIAVLWCLICTPLWAGSYPVIDGPCHLVFPDDHQSHDLHRTEWWYVTANLHDPSGNRYGVQLTIFRRRLHPVSDDIASVSAWRTPQLYIVHAAVTDVEHNRHDHAEDMVRAGPGLAGSTREGDDVVISMKRNRIRFTISGLVVHAETGGIAFTLDLAAKKPIILHGDKGYSQKGPARDSASCYSSYTRLMASGHVMRDGKIISVSGTAWMDHEYSSKILDKGIAGWDWFSLQLSTGDEIMLFVMRPDDVSTLPFVSATWVAATGEIRLIPREAMSLDIAETWTSPETGTIYPSQWFFTLQPLQLSVEISPILANQEMVTAERTGVIYYEGAVDVVGTAKGALIQGVGYVEMTGYAGGLDGRM